MSEKIKINRQVLFEHVFVKTPDGKVHEFDNISLKELNEHFTAQGYTEEEMGEWEIGF